MRTLEEYMALHYKMEIRPDSAEPGYIVKFPELPGCLTCADTLERALENAQDAKRVWLEGSIEDGYPIPEPAAAQETDDIFELSVPSGMIYAIARASERDGVSVKQFCMDALTRAVSV